MLEHLLPLLTVVLVAIAWTATWRLMRRRQLPIRQAVIFFAVLLAISLLAAGSYGRSQKGETGREQRLIPEAAVATGQEQAELRWSWQTEPPVLRISNSNDEDVLVIGVAGPDACDRLRQGLGLLKEELQNGPGRIPLQQSGDQQPSVAAWCTLQQICSSQGFHLLGQG